MIARVLVTRDPAAARVLTDLLRERGYEPCVARLQEPELPADVAPLRALLATAAAPELRTWLAITSASTVAALDAVGGAEWAQAIEAARHANPPLKVAAVGDATARFLSERGIGVDFVPTGDHSAAGMVAQWPEHAEPQGAYVLLPASAQASPTLARGLRAKGFVVRAVDAYVMSEAPAPRALHPHGKIAGGAPELTSIKARTAVRNASLAAVVATAPSRVAALLDTYGEAHRAPRPMSTTPVPAVRPAWVAIGEPTAQALRERGIEPVIARSPAPLDLANAVDEALHSPRSTHNELHDMNQEETP